MDEIATIFKVLNLYAHAAHNLVNDATFFADHSFLESLYAEYDKEYDSTIERMLGLDSPVFLKTISGNAQRIFESLPLDVRKNDEYFRNLIELENALLGSIAEKYPSVSIGTQQLIGEQANQAEGRLYKLKQRVKA
jgi:DNA-binding ferritin-like protein